MKRIALFLLGLSLPALAGAQTLSCTGASITIKCGKTGQALPAGPGALRCPGGATATLVCYGGQPASAPPVFIPAPTSSVCSPPPGWGCSINPHTVNPAPAGTVAGAPLDMSLARTYVFSAPANVVHAFRITFDPAAYPGSGAAVTTNQIVVNPNRRDVVISNSPGSMTPLNFSFGCRTLNNAENSAVYVNFAGPAPGACFLAKGQQYWLNIKATDAGMPMNYLLQPYPM